MAGNLHLIAANGTDNLSEQINTKQDTLDYLLNAMDTEERAARLLRGAGLLTLREKAGYVPAQDPRSMDKIMPTDSDHEQVAFSAEVLHFLNKIYWGNYVETYPEWLHWVALEDVAFPYEALPLILSLATWFPSTQALTKRILGSRGRWLIEQSGHRGWYWTKHIKPARRPRLTKYEKYEARISDKLQKLQYRAFSIEITFELRRMNFPWSWRFSEAIARTLKAKFALQKQMQVDDLARMADLIKLHIHPAHRETIISAFRTYNQLEETQSITRDLADILHFRAEMTAVFDKQEKQSQ